MIIKKILVVLIGIPLGLAIIKYREKLYQWTGPIGFAEKYLGTGGTFTILALVGGLVVIGAIVYATGALNILLGKLTGVVPF